MCTLCGYKCDTLTGLKGHRSTYRSHRNALNRAVANGKSVNEDEMEYHSKNPANLDELIEVADYDSIGEYMDHKIRNQDEEPVNTTSIGTSLLHVFLPSDD